MSDNDTNDRGSARRESLGGEFSERLSRLDTALKKAQAERADDQDDLGPQASQGMQGMAQALRLASEFAAAILVGSALGWAIDWFVGTSPWGLIVFLMLGFVAGVLNVLRSAGLAKEPGTPD